MSLIDLRVGTKVISHPLCMAACYSAPPVPRIARFGRADKGAGKLRYGVGITTGHSPRGPRLIHKGN
jgi:hypothetical protein